MRERRLTDWLLERYRLGELPAPQLDAVRCALADDAHARARLEALDASDREILHAHPPAPAVAAIRRRAEGAPAPVRTRAPRWLVAAPALAVALAAALVIRHPGREAVPEAGGAGGETRAKGLQRRLVIYRVTGGEAEALRDGAAARPGDNLQLAYVSAGRRFGVIVSIDGRGQVTLHLPAAEGSSAVALEARREVALPRAYQLDDAPGFERFFFVTSDSPYGTDPVLAAGRALASSPGAAREPLGLAPGLEQTTLSLRKIAK